MSPTRPLALAIDAGSGSCRALIFDDTGESLGLAQREWAYHAVPDAPGGFDFDTVAGWGERADLHPGGNGDGRHRGLADRRCCRQQHARGVRSLRRCRRVLWACPNIDARAGVEAEEMIGEGLAEAQYFRGGDWTSITAPARLRWIQRHQPEHWKRARHLTMLGDWVVYRLSGVFSTDPSLGSSSNLFDWAMRDWSPDSAAEVGLPDPCRRSSNRAR